VEQNSSISNSREKRECLASKVSGSACGDYEPVSTGPYNYLEGQLEGQREVVFTLQRVGLFLGIIAALIVGLDATITAGLRRMPTIIYGVNNRIMEGKINAQLVVVGSSRAASHFDPTIIHQETGLTAFNLGRNGSQTDMQIAVLKTYLKHNRTPEFVIFNLDAFTFQTTHEVYNPAQYVPYLREDELYRPLRKINPNIWKSRYLPLYGYIAEDMSFAWIQGLRAFLPWPQRERLFDGFDPRDTKWTDDFEKFKAKNSRPIKWDIEPAAVALMQELVDMCHEKSIQLVFVYSPEYSGMQALTGNRDEVFSMFAATASRHGVPIWDYSGWRHASETEYFTNSQHLNAAGAEVFSRDVGVQLKKYTEARAAAQVVQGISSDARNSEARLGRRPHPGASGD
jgi:hypothetical protein